MNIIACFPENRAAVGITVVPGGIEAVTAFCSPHDHYSRAEAHDKIYRRKNAARRGKYIFNINKDFGNLPTHTIVHAVVEAFNEAVKVANAVYLASKLAGTYPLPSRVQLVHANFVHNVTQINVEELQTA